MKSWSTARRTAQEERQRLGKRNRTYKGKEYRREKNRAYMQTHREMWRTSGAKSTKKVRDEVLAFYGTTCQECGNIENLHTDHIDQNGRNHKNHNGKPIKGVRLWYWLRKNGFPPGFRTLCGICNITAYYLHQLGFDVAQQGFMERARILLRTVSLVR